MPVTSAFPPAPPTVSGTRITVDRFLRDPAMVNRAIRDLTLERFVADVIFGTGPTADGGAVVYDQVSENDLYLENDIQEIEPGAEFPLLGAPDAGPLVALARKYGGEVLLTYEQIRRDRRDILNRRMTQLRNTIVRFVDGLALAALNAAPINTAVASGDWSTAATDIIADLVTATSLVSNLDLGYIVDTAIIHPNQEADLLKDKDIRDALPRERDNGIIRTGNLGRLMGVDFIVTNRQTAGTIHFLQRRVAGSISDEVPTYARVIDDERRERRFIHGARIPAIYVTDPKAVVRMTGA